MKTLSDYRVAQPGKLPETGIEGHEIVVASDRKGSHYHA
jgi:hypothetical protein